MGEITIDQLNAVFGDLKRSQETQTRALTRIESIVSEKVANVTDHIVSLKNSIDSLTKNVAKSSSRRSERGTTQRTSQGSPEKISSTINTGFRALASSLLTREGKLQATVKPKLSERRSITTEGAPTKAERLILRSLNEQNTKTAALLKEVRTQRSSKKEDGGIFKYLSPFLLLFGGVAALTYGAMKIPGVSGFFQNLKTGGIKQTLSGLINKIKPQDKTIMEWLRSLPIIGRVFDIYDAVMAFTKGDWKTGLKYLAFAIPGAELFAEILAGKGAKQKILAQGGATAAFKSISLNGIWTNIKTLVGEAFDNISTTFKEIREIFGLVVTGDQTKMIEGFTKLAQYFPILTPIAEVLASLTSATFDSTFAKAAEARVGTGNVKFGDILQEVMHNVFEKIGKVFTVIGNVFNSAIEIISSLGDIFSDDYGKQATALNRLDKISPGTSSMLRQVLTITEAFRELDIKDTDDLVTKLKKVSKATWKSITAKGDKYSARMTRQREEIDIYEKAQQEVDPEKRAELDKKAAAMRLENAQAELVEVTSQIKVAREKYNKMVEANEESIRTKGYAEYDIPTQIEPVKKDFEMLVARGTDIAARKRYAEQYIQQLAAAQTTPNITGSFSAKKQPFNYTDAFDSINESSDTAYLRNDNVNITPTPEQVKPNTGAAEVNINDALKGLPLDDLSYLKYLPTTAQLLKDQNTILTQLLQINKDQPAPVFANINQGGPMVFGGSGNRQPGGRNAF